MRKPKEGELWTLAALLPFLLWGMALLAGYRPQECEEAGKSCYTLQEPISLLLYPFFWVANWIDGHDKMVVGLSGIAVAAFTFTLWRSTKALWQAGERQYRLSEDTAQRQLRAYVDVTKSKSEYLKSAEFPEQIRFMIIVENRGQTPARDVKAWVTCNASQTFNPAIAVKDRSGGSVNPIGPGGELKFEFGTNDRGLPIEAVQAVRDRQTNIWVQGFVEYTDIYELRHEVGFRFRVEPGREQKPALQICQEGNYST